MKPDKALCCRFLFALTLTVHKRQCIVYEPKIKVRIHDAILRAILRAMAELHRVSTPKFVARNIARNIAAVENRPTSATLRATNFFVYPPSAAFRAIV